MYYLGSAGLASSRSRPRALGDEMDPLAAGMLPDGSLAAGPGLDGGWRGAGGRWLHWPLRVVLWTALLVIAFRGITAIVFSHVAAPAGGGPEAGAGQFPVGLADGMSVLDLHSGKWYVKEIGASTETVGAR